MLQLWKYIFFNTGLSPADVVREAKLHFGGSAFRVADFKSLLAFAMAVPPKLVDMLQKSELMSEHEHSAKQLVVRRRIEADKCAGEAAKEQKLRYMFDAYYEIRLKKELEVTRVLERLQKLQPVMRFLVAEVIW